LFGHEVIKPLRNSNIEKVKVFLIITEKSVPNYSTVTDCFGKGVVPKNRSDVAVDFDLLEIILDLRKKYRVN